MEVCWIPSEFAECGKRIDIGKAPDLSKGWTVVEAYSTSDVESIQTREAAQRELARKLS